MGGIVGQRPEAAAQIRFPLKCFDLKANAPPTTVKMASAVNIIFAFFINFLLFRIQKAKL